MEAEEEEDNKNSKFDIDVSAIQCIEKDKQDVELHSLEISVFDQSTFEKGVIQQVGKALTGDSNHFLEDNTTAHTDLEEGQIDDEICSEELKTDEDESQSKKRTQDPMFKIEEYLRTQAKFQEFRKTSQSVTPKKQVSNLKVVKDKKLPKVKEKKKKKELKSNYVGPAKVKPKKDKLGSKVRKTRNYSVNEPALQPGEENYFYLNTSGSEFVPSDNIYSSDDSFNETKIASKKPKLAVPRRKKSISFNINNLSSDDSDWDSAEEDVPKRRGNKELDDGDVDIFTKRMKQNHTNKYDWSVEEIQDDFVVPKDIWDKLYKYQKDAVKWFWRLNQDRCGGILGDEMGLGKTIQTIAFLAALHRSDITDYYTRYKGLGPTLIVCPTTVMHQWVREFHTWYPPLRVAILHDSGTYSGKDRRKLISSIHNDPYGVIITSYSGLVQYQDSIVPKQWHYVILDEGHKIRNPKAKVTVAAKQIDTPNRLILSGSPLQNNLQELWSLIDFVFPEKLGTLQVFMETFAIPIVQGGYANASQTQVVTAHKCATILKDTITPYLLRRMKEDVGFHINLPEKKEQVLFCKLTEEQREIYKKYIEDIDIDDVVRGRSKIFVPLINLRKICNHPDLYSGGPQRNFRISSGVGPPNENQFGYWKRAGKLIVIETLLKIWKEQGHRVLLFTQGKKMLMIMEDFVRRNNYKYLKLDGSTTIGSRQPLIDKFNKDTNYFVMLLTTRVGGLGVNLTGANRVVIYDPDWNPATDTQARERAWRIGQQKDVTIYRLITAGTIEEKIYHRQIFKQFLSNRVLKDPKQRRFFKSNDLLELFTLSETVKNGTTETAAIFAGTGSEVKIPKKLQSRVIKPKQVIPEEEIKFSESKIEQMKKLAQALSKKLLEKNIQNNETAQQVQTNSEAVENEAMTTDSNKENHQERNASNEDGIYGPDGTINVSSALKAIASQKKDSEAESKPIGLSFELNESVPKATDGLKSEVSNITESKLKRKKKSGEKFATFNGQEVPHLLKKKKYKKKDKEKEKEEYVSQDDYVLKKLFSRGIDSALQHDKIMDDGGSDFAIVEAEAERVAQDALKKLRQSQIGPSRFSSPVKKDKKPGSGTSLLDIIKKRNMILDSEHADQHLLSDMISWLQSQGGTASTDQLVNEFRPRVGPGKSPLFKKLLESIAKFYRAPDKVGYWTIKDEFSAPSTSHSS